MNDYFIKFENAGHRGALAMTLSDSQIYFSRRRNDLLIGRLRSEEAEKLQQQGALLIPSQQHELSTKTTFAKLGSCLHHYRQ